MSVSTSDPMIGRLIDGRYQVRSRIARGGMATVYLATDLRLERRVAIKIMHGHLADDNQFKQRFIQEARSAARLAHPNVVNVFDQGQDEESAYLVMEYLPGITLRDLLHDYGALTSEQTIDITEAVLSGLAAAHKAGIVHRDLKPENVLLADDGRIKIGDFGLARAASANTATGAALLGTIAYLSPELVTRGVADTRSDVYAVGIMMYEMLTGEQPFKGEQPMAIAYQHANDSVPTPSSANPKVPAELDELVLWATARDPEERPRDARALLEQVQDTESMLQTALPAAGATAVQKTLVLPGPLGVARDAETQVIGGVPTAATRQQTASAPEVSDSTVALTTVSRQRSRRGWIIALVVVLLAALAGGTGWWFGFGPGARIDVPSVADSSVADATAKLTEAGLRVDPQQGQVASLDVPAGQVAATDPDSGVAVARDSVVKLLISTGPEMIDLPGLVGLDEKAADAVVSSHWTKGTDTVRQFSSDAEGGIVLQALGVDAKGDTVDLGQTAQYGEKQPISLVVSAGPLPDVAGDSVDDATKKLQDAGLSVGATTTDYSEDVEKGDVVSLVAKNADGSDKPVRVGDTVDLLVSDGPPPVTVPDVVGQSWDKAKKALTDLGFKVQYNHSGPADVIPSAFTVSKIDPGAGTSQPKGSTIKVTLDFSG
ncbi:Stk1 family PASTA domain-containing Ser/Thr kinase [Schumannella sp. 10F1B-5-1]|uniref:Stk1 family PASTA domain-containing Ser/Thr kinase n=1 Tax=Schumannella sp. 10F1B-5-1 TaxID=2590780 RepID=UPI001130A15D|nr:Stk1 family PASTA domain-containing Ser/Thr kinase [Schumannella sp. 10F1B-5-1]TPW73796.1 Stk1 family PASTA domain-containing Ser/Thr kinase [Schumannella sp. 10F1B-5-1]